MWLLIEPSISFKNRTEWLRITKIDRVNYGIPRILCLNTTTSTAMTSPSRVHKRAHRKRTPLFHPWTPLTHCLFFSFRIGTLIAFSFATSPLLTCAPLSLSSAPSPVLKDFRSTTNDRRIDRFEGMVVFSDMTGICMKSFCSTFRPRNGLSFWLDLEHSSCYWSLGIGFQEVNAGGS